MFSQVNDLEGQTDDLVEPTFEEESKVDLHGKGDYGDVDGENDDSRHLTSNNLVAALKFHHAGIKQIKSSGIFTEILEEKHDLILKQLRQLAIISYFIAILVVVCLYHLYKLGANFNAIISKMDVIIAKMDAIITMSDAMQKRDQ